MPALGTGLLPVYQMTAAGQVASCGVVDTRGEWVLPPKKGVNYAPLSKVMVAELPAKYRLTENMASPENFKVLRLGGTKEPITANVVGHRLFTNHNNFTMLIGDTGKNGRFAYYNASGEQLTDNNLLNGGRHLERLNIVTVRDKKGGVLDVIVDQQGKTVAELPGLEADRVYDGPKHWTIAYFTAKERSSGLQGVVDSMGRTVLPFRYKELKIMVPGRLLSCTNEAGKTELLNWQGTVLFTASGKTYTRLYEPKNGYLLVGMEGLNETAVITPDNQFARVIPAESPGQFASPPMELAHLATLSFRSLQKYCWVDFVTGKVYREQ